MRDIDDKILKDFTWSAYLALPGSLKSKLEGHLLLEIVSSDERLNQDFRTWEACSRLLLDEPDFRVKLVDCWKTGCFDEVRRSSQLQRYMITKSAVTGSSLPIISAERNAAPPVGLWRDGEEKTVNIFGGDFTTVHGDLIDGSRYSKKRIQEWLCKFDYAVRHREIASKRTPETGIWFLESVEFDIWASDGKAQVLWCPGMPGAGKTTLSSLVVDHLESVRRVPTCVVYLDYKHQSEQNPRHILGSILGQLLDQHPCGDILKIDTLYSRHLIRKSEPSEEELLDTLKRSLSILEKVYVVIDALDEYATDYRGTYVMGIVHKLASVSRNLRLMVTSRVLGEMESYFEDLGAVRLAISPPDHDIQLCLQSYFSDELLLFAEHSQYIIEKILAAADGRMLLAHLQIRSLCSLLSWGEIRDALNRLPEEIDLAYDQVMMRINEQEGRRRDLALQVLTWVAYGHEELSVSELQYALAVAPNRIDVESYMHHLDTITSVCAGLVIIDPESNQVRLNHYTAQEFFDNERNRYFPKADEIIFNTCLLIASHLPLDDTTRQQSGTTMQLPMDNYVCAHWHAHLLECENDIFLDKQAFQLKRSKLLQLLRFSIYWHDCYGFYDHRHPTCSWKPIHAFSMYTKEGDQNHGVGNSFRDIHLAAALDLPCVLNILWDGDDTVLDAKTSDSSGYLPLEIALKLGAARTSMVLWEAYCTDDRWRQLDYSRILKYALQGGFVAVIDRIIEVAPSSVTAHGNAGMDPLVIAAENGHASILQMLLNQMNTDIGVDTYEKVLNGAFRSQDNDTIKLIIEDPRLEPGASVPDFTYEQVRNLLGIDTSIYMWIQTYHSQEFLEQRNETVVGLAAQNNRVDVIEHLLTRYPAEVNKANLNGQTPLACAARSGEVDAVEHFLTYADVKSGLDNQDTNGRTPLLHALRHDLGASVDFDEDMMESCWPNIRYGDDEIADIVSMLLEAGADANMIDDSGRSPMSFAGLAASQPVLELLQDSGANLHAVDLHGRTPLAYALGGRPLVHDFTTRRSVLKRRWVAIEWLLGNGANLHILDKEGKSPLDWAKWRNEDFILSKLEAYMVGAG